MTKIKSEEERKKHCKYCKSDVVIVPYNKKEAKLYAEHLKHKNR